MTRPTEDSVPPGEGTTTPNDVKPAGGALPPSPLIGKIISGRYRVERLLATGGVSSVYLAQHVLMHKNVALKVLDANAEKLPEFVARFQREAVAGAHVQNPYIAAATDFGQLDDGSYFLVQEYVPGRTLNQVIAKGPMAPVRAANIARRLAAAIGAAHDVGIVHRDIKPSNVILVEGTEDVVKLIDFGFAKLKFSDLPTLAPPPDEPVIPDRNLTAAGVVLGTVAYMAPEAAQGMSAVDQRSDWYALGLILYELLSAQHPFDGKDPVRLFLQQRTELPPPIAKRTPGVNVPAALEAVARKLLEKDPKDRYSNVAEVEAAIQAAMISAGFDPVLEPPRGRRSDHAIAERAAAQKPSVPPASDVAPVGVAVLADVDDDAASEARTVKRAVPPTVTGVHVDGARSTAARGDDAVTNVMRADEVRGIASRARSADRTAEGAANPPKGGASVPADSASSDPLTRLPVVGAWIARLPDDPFPRWAYLAFAALGIVLVALFASMFGRTHAASVAVLSENAGAPVASAPGEGGSAPREVPMEVAGLDVAGWKMNLRNAVRRKEWAGASDAVLTLLHLDPTVFRDHDVQNALRSTAVALEDAGGEPADKFFDTLTTKSGAQGLDLVYDIARNRSWTKAGKRATEILRRPDVMMAASPALKVVFDFREASCPGRRDLFARMAEQGDERALSELGQQQAADCGRRDPCCYKENRALAMSIRALKARLASQPAAPGSQGAAAQPSSSALQPPASAEPAPSAAPVVPAAIEGAGASP